MVDTVLITGAGRGLGAALAGTFAAAQWCVLASCRNPPDAAELDAYIARYPTAITKLALDVSEFAAIEALAQQLQGTAIDVLLSNAAATGGAVGEFGRTDYAAWDIYHRVNTQAPMRLAECFVEHLAASRRKVFFAISSRVGARPSFGFVGYRASKSALNQVVLQLSLALAPRGITCACAHPGYVQTRATQYSGALTPAASAAMLYRVIDTIDLRQTGRFFDPDGSCLPIVTQQTETRSYAKSNP
jgi:NAD(P)-dependent dehydrogenase (short-subunit alcohol dehydrogenase family)